MRKLRAIVLTLAFTLVLTSAFTISASQKTRRLMDNCSCTASDGSCSVSVSCAGGCTRYCGNNNNCYAYCSGSYSFLGREVTLQMKNANYPQLVAELADISGKEIAFSPTKSDIVFDVGFERAPLWDALELLSNHGTVRIAGQDFEKLKRLRRILLSEEKISFGVKNTPINTVVNDMASLTGLPLRITAGSPMSTVNVQLRNVTLNDILAKVSEQAGTKITEEGAEPGAQ